MRSKFREQFAINKEEIKEVWKNALVVFDTNILLNLYRYNKDTCNDLLKYMKTFENRLWMPFQVGWEYHNNRVHVAYQYQNAYSELIKLIDENRKRIEEFFRRFPQHPKLSSKRFLEHYDNLERELKKYLKDLDKEDEKYFDKDTILETLADLYDGKVGEDYTDEEYTAIFKEGDKRYKSKTPPGYKDDTKDKRETQERKLYGDYIVWCQLIDKARMDDKDIIFVSDDLKEDWVLEIHGKKKGPRKELLKEFYVKTGKAILIYSQEQFLEYAHTKEKANIKDETIKEVKSVQLDWQRYYNEYSKQLSLTDLLGYSLPTKILPKTLYNDNGLLTTLNNYKLLGDSLKLQDDNMQSALEPYSILSKSVFTPNYPTIRSLSECVNLCDLVNKTCLETNSKRNNPLSFNGIAFSPVDEHEK